VHAGADDASAGASVGAIVGSAHSARARSGARAVAGGVDGQRVVVVVRRVVQVQLEETENRLHRAARAHPAHLPAARQRSNISGLLLKNTTNIPLPRFERALTGMAVKM